MEIDTSPSPIIRTKLNHPPVPGDHVHRLRLLGLLDKAREGPLMYPVTKNGRGRAEPWGL
jgi:hypothetical protein